MSVGSATSVEFAVTKRTSRSSGLTVAGTRTVWEARFPAVLAAPTNEISPWATPLVAVTCWVRLSVAAPSLTVSVTARVPSAA